MSKQLPTVRIAHPGGTGTMVINERDYDATVHRLASEESGSDADEPEGDEPETPAAPEAPVLPDRPAALESPQAWSSSSADSCIKALAAIEDVMALDAVKDVETGATGKNRKTVLDAIERRRKALQA